MIKIDYLPKFNIEYVSKVIGIKGRSRMYSSKLDGNTFTVSKGNSYFRMEYDGVNEIRTEFNFDYKSENLDKDQITLVYAFDDVIKTVKKSLSIKARTIIAKFYAHVAMSSLILIVYPIIIDMTPLLNIFIYGMFISFCFRIIKIAHSNTEYDLKSMEDELKEVNEKRRIINENNNKQ